MVVVKVGDTMYKHPNGVDAFPIEGLGCVPLIVLDDDGEEVATHHAWDVAWNGDEHIIYDKDEKVTGADGHEYHFKTD